LLRLRTVNSTAERVILYGQCQRYRLSLHYTTDQNFLNMLRREYRWFSNCFQRWKVRRQPFFAGTSQFCEVEKYVVNRFSQARHSFAKWIIKVPPARCSEWSKFAITRIEIRTYFIYLREIFDRSVVGKCDVLAKKRSTTSFFQRWNSTSIITYTLVPGYLLGSDVECSDYETCSLEVRKHLLTCGWNKRTVFSCSYIIIIST